MSVRSFVFLVYSGLAVALLDLESPDLARDRLIAWIRSKGRLEVGFKIILRPKMLLTTNTEGESTNCMTSNLAWNFCMCGCTLVFRSIHSPGEKLLEQQFSCDFSSNVQFSLITCVPQTNPPSRWTGFTHPPPYSSGPSVSGGVHMPLSSQHRNCHTFAAAQNLFTPLESLQSDELNLFSLLWMKINMRGSGDYIVHPFCL